MDHYGGLESVVRKYQIGEFWFNGDLDNSAASYLSLIQILRDRGVMLHPIHQGEEYRWDSGVTLRWLWPVHYEEGQRNEVSLVGRLSWGSEDVLLTGDLPSEQERSLLQSHQTLEAEVLKVGHHGSKNSSDVDFLAAVQPKLCLISAGKDNSYGHPHADTLKRLQDVNCQIISTIDNGSMTVELTTSTWRWYRSADLPNNLFLGILKKVNII
jgi:competence protein ComEC